MAQDGIIRPKNTVLLGKIESSVGVDASPAAADAILIQNLAMNFNPNLINTDEYTGSLDGAGPILGGFQAVELSFEVYLKGVSTPGTAPEWGKLLRACAMSETILATALPASAEACAAGGSTTTATLGTTAAATAQQYRGMPINFTGAVAGAAFISDYTAAKVATLTDLMSGSIIATTSYQIPANVVYGPASNTIPSLTFYAYADGLLYKFIGCRGTFEQTINTNGVGVLRFTMRGAFASKTDAAVISSPVYDATRPPIFQNGKMLMDRKAAAVAQFSLSLGAELSIPDDPNQPEGTLPPIHNSRKITGSVNPLETLVATRDIMSDFRAGTRRIVHARYGSVAGNRIGITIPAAHYTNHTPGDRNGLGQVTVPFEATGRDAGCFLCVY